MGGGGEGGSLKKGEVADLEEIMYMFSLIFQSFMEYYFKQLYNVPANAR